MKSEVQSREARAGQAARPAAPPGAWQAAVIAVLSALGALYWARTATGTAHPQASPDASTIAEVTPEDLPAALDTVDEQPQQLAAFRNPDACHREHLAWVTIAHGPNQPAGRIRLKSGRYFSPAFEVGETPLRLAIPYPAPYNAGRGVIEILAATTPTVMALTPPWPVAAMAGRQFRQVTWTPVRDCPGN